MTKLFFGPIGLFASPVKFWWIDANVPKNCERFIAAGFKWITRVGVPHSLRARASNDIKVDFPHPAGPTIATGLIGLICPIYISPHHREGDKSSCNSKAFSTIVETIPVCLLNLFIDSNNFFEKDLE